MNQEVNLFLTKYFFFLFLFFSFIFFLLFFQNKKNGFKEIFEQKKKKFSTNKTPASLPSNLMQDAVELHVFLQITFAFLYVYSILFLFIFPKIYVDKFWNVNFFLNYLSSKKKKKSNISC